MLSLIISEYAVLQPDARVPSLTFHSEQFHDRSPINPTRNPRESSRGFTCEFNTTARIERDSIGSSACCNVVDDQQTVTLFIRRSPIRADYARERGHRKLTLVCIRFQPPARFLMQYYVSILLANLTRMPHERNGTTDRYSKSSSA